MYIHYAFSESDRFEEAVECLQEAIACNANLLRAHVSLARLYDKQGHTTSTEKYIKSAQQLTIYDTEDYLLLTSLLYELSRS